MNQVLTCLFGLSGETAPAWNRHDRLCADGSTGFGCASFIWKPLFGHRPRKPPLLSASIEQRLWIVLSVPCGLCGGNGPTAVGSPSGGGPLCGVQRLGTVLVPCTSTGHLGGSVSHLFMLPNNGCKTWTMPRCESSFVAAVSQPGLFL